METHGAVGVQEVEKAQQEVYGIGERVELAERVNRANTIQHYPAPFSPIYSLSVFSLIRLHPASPVALFDPLPGLLFDHFEVAC